MVRKRARKRKISFSEKELLDMKEASKALVKLCEKIAKKWKGRPSAVHDIRMSREHAKP